MGFEEMAFADVDSPQQAQEVLAKAMELVTEFMLGDENIPADVALALGFITGCAGRTMEAELEAQRLEWCLDQAMANPCKACGAKER